MDSLTIRPAGLNDAEDIWTWRNSDEAYKYYKNPQRQSLEEHISWMCRAVADAETILWIVEEGSLSVSHVRVDTISHCDSAISIVVDGTRQGEGIGKRSLSLAIEQLRQLDSTKQVFAEIHRDNKTSCGLFKSAGFEPHSQSGPFLKFMLSLIS